MTSWPLLGTGMIYKVSLQHCFIQAEKFQLSQFVFFTEVLQLPDHLHDPPLDSLQHVHILPVLMAPELDLLLQVGSHLERGLNLAV